MTSSFRILFFSGLILFSFIQGFAQTLTLQTVGGANDVQVGNDNFTAARGSQAMVDVHQTSGVVIYTWCEADDQGNLGGNRNIHCAIYDKDLNPLVTSFRVNNSTTGDQQTPTVRINQEENTFVIAWGSNHAADGTYDIYAKKIDIYLTNSSTVASQSDVLINGTSTTTGTSTAGSQLYPSVMIT